MNARTACCAIRMHPSIPRAALHGAAALAIGLSLIVAAPLASAATPTPAEESMTVRTLHSFLHADAVDAFVAQRYSAAFGRFALLADAGHAPSASIALMMVRHGRSMFGTDWSATPEQLERWTTLVAQDLREHGASIAANEASE